MATRPGDEFARRIDALVEGLASNRGDGAALRALGESYEQLIATETEPARRAQLWGEFAAHCHQFGLADAAVTALERARALAPNDVKLTHALAVSLVSRSESADGRTKALDLDRVADLLCDVSLALDPVEGRKFLISALGHAPWHARALYELERATPESERATLANHWVAYLAHNPEGDLAQTRRVALARAYLAAGQTEDALFALEPAAKTGSAQAIALLAELRAPPPPATGEVITRPGGDPITMPGEPQPGTQAVPAATAAGVASSAALPAAAGGGEDARAAVSADVGESSREAAPAHDALFDAAAEHDALRDDSAEQAALLDGAAVRDASLDDSAEHDALLDDAAVHDASLDDAAEHEALLDEAAVHDASLDDSAEHDALLDDAAVQDASLDDAAEHDAPLDDAAVHDASLDDSAEHDALLDDAAVHDASLDDSAEHDALVARESEPRESSRVRSARADGSGERVTAADGSGEHPAPRVERSAAAARAVPRRVDTSDFADPDMLGVEALDAEAEPNTAARAATAAVDEARREIRAASAVGDTARALELALALLQFSPTDTVAFDVAEREYRRGRDFGGRALLLLSSSERDGLPVATRRQRLRDAAQLFEQKLSDPDAALRCYQALLRVDDHADDTLRAMARLLERAGRWDALCECLEQTLILQREAAQKIALLRRLGDIQRRERKDRAAAANALARLIELDPNDRTARVTLAEDLAALERYDDLAKLLERRIEEPASKAERVGLLRQLASLCEGPLHDAEAAYRVYERVLVLIPDDATALTRMEEIDEKAGAHERLLTTLQRRAARAPHAQAAQLLVRMATIAEADLLDPERAYRFLREALDDAPQNAQIALALANLCERVGRYDELLVLLRERVRTEKQPKARAELLRRIARLLAQHLNDDAGAAGVYAALNELGDDFEAWSFIEQHARKHNDASALVGALDKLCTLENEPSVLRARLLERSELLSQLGRKAEAVEPVVRVLLEIDGGDGPARRRLEALCTELSDYRSLSRVLEELLANAHEPKQRARLAKELSELYVERLPDDKRELKALLMWSEAAPEDPEVWRKLAGIYERRRRHKELLEALDALGRLEPEPEARAAAQLAAAELCLHRLKDNAATLVRIELYVRGTSGPLPAVVLELARKAEGLRELCQLCEATGRYEELCELLQERIAHSIDPERKAELYRQLATTLIEQRQDETAALAAYEGLLSLADDVEALRFVQSWATRHDDPQRLADVLGRLARCENNLNERRDLWLERGRILRTQLQQPSAAIDAFVEALALDPEFAPALDELLAACEAAGDHARLADALERKLALGTAQPLSATQRLADLYEGPLGDDARAISALKRWATLTPQDAHPLRRLRVQYRRGEHLPELLATLDALARAEADPFDQREASVAAAELAYERMNDVDGAFTRLAPLVAAEDEAVDRALLAIADRSQRLPEVYALLEHARRYADLAYQLERAARRAVDAHERAAFLKRAARVLQTHLNDVERTSAAYSELLGIEEDVDALRFMQARALEAGETSALADILLRLCRLESDPRELRDLLFDYAHLQTFRLRSPQLAIPVLRRILTELDAEFEPALDELLRAAEAARDSDALAFGLSRAIEREHDSGRKAELAERLANLFERQLKDDAGSVRALQLWASLSSHSLEPVRRLRAYYEKHARYGELLESLDHIAVHSGSRDERQEAALAGAKLCLGPLADPDAAFARLTELMRSGVVQAEDALYSLAFTSGKLDELCDVYERSGRYDDVCELLRKRAESEPDVNLRAELYVRCARLLANTIADEFAAAEAYRQVLEQREDAEALRYLRRVAEQQDDVETLDQALARLAALSEPAERSALLLTRALLLRDRLSQPERACVLLQTLLTETAGAPGALREQVVSELEATAELIEDRTALAAALEARLTTQRDGTKRRAIALHLADLCEAELNDADRAAAALRIACSADPRHLGARRRLKQHLARQGAWQEYLSLLDTLVHLEPNPGDRRAARLQSANTAYERLSDSAGALTRLNALVIAGDAEAEKIAQSIAQASGLGRELAAMYITRARQTTNPADAEASWRMVMQIHEQWLDDPAEAFEAALRLLAADPNSRAHLDEVDRLAVKLKAFARLAQIYAKLIRAAPSDALRVELNTRLSRLHEADGEAQAALEYAILAARAAPTDAQLLARVERLAAAQRNQGEVFWAQEQRALAARDSGGAFEAWLAAARTADLAQRDREQATACMRRALALTEHAPERADRLLEVAQECDATRPELGPEDARRALLRAHLELAEQANPDFRTQLVLRAARIASEALQDERTGFDVLRGGAALPPFAEALLDALETAAVRIGRLDALDAQLARSAERSEEVSDKQRLLARRARVLTEHLGRFDHAAQVYERLIELAPNDARVAALQLECLRKAGRPRELLRACERRLPHLKDAQAKLALMREMAMIWEVELKNRASALALWIDVRALAPRDEEATLAVERLRALDAS